MFRKKKKREYRTNLICKTTIPSDDLWVGDGDEHEIIRHSGLGVFDVLARFLINSEAVIYDLHCDYEHNCWVVSIKWKDKHFDLYIYNFYNLQIRITRSKGTEAYFELIQLLHNFLTDDGRFSEITWCTDKNNEEFTTPF